MTEPTSFNGFGVPVHVPGYFELASELDHSFTDGSPLEIGDVTSDAAYRMMLADATGRWRFSGGWAEPSMLVPGDVVALSALYTMGLALARGDATAPTPVLRPESTSLARAILDARNYWLPRGAVSALLSSNLPAEALDDLRLPAPMCALWFAQPVEIPADAIPDELLGHADALDEFARTPGRPYIERPLAATMATLRDLATGDDVGHLEGVLLFADATGAPRDHIGWFVRDAKADNRMLARTLLLGRRLAAGWRNVIDLATAIVGWGDWAAPERFTPDIAWNADRATKRQLRKGRTRRLEEAGGLSNVVVLDTRRRAPSRGDGLGTHASPITHARRDHFRRVLVGPRDAPRREWRWIPPTIVNPDGPGRGVFKVYRLPRPR